MTERIYSIRDNGLRCFISPCFSWDIVDVEARSVYTASALDVSKLGLSTEQEKQVITSLTKGQFNVAGYMVDDEVELSDELPPEKGTRFVVVQILGYANA